MNDARWSVKRENEVYVELFFELGVSSISRESCLKYTFHPSIVERAYFGVVVGEFHIISVRALSNKNHCFTGRLFQMLFIHFCV